MIEVSGNIPLIPFEMGLFVKREFGEALLFISHSVRLEVGFGDNIQAVSVAEFVPVRVIRIVACAHGVDVHLFHPQDVLKHPFSGYHVASVRVHLMSVCALEKHRLSVYEHLGILQFDFPEADLYGDDFPAAAVVCRGGQCIEIRCLCRPFVRGIHFHPYVHGAFACPDLLPGGDIPVHVCQDKRYIAAACGLKFNVKGAVVVAAVKVRGNPDVLNPVFLPCIEPAVAGDP